MKNGDKQAVIGVGGMSCQGCVKNVTGVLQALPGVEPGRGVAGKGAGDDRFRRGASR